MLSLFLWFTVYRYFFVSDPSPSKRSPVCPGMSGLSLTPPQCPPPPLLTPLPSALQERMGKLEYDMRDLRAKNKVLCQ